VLLLATKHKNIAIERKLLFLIAIFAGFAKPGIMRQFIANNSIVFPELTNQMN
jgi:heme/copper-type cytochrome/quinol oxidase subunit 1